MALDAEAAGQQQWRALAREAALRGKRVAALPAAYGGHKDVNEAWVAGTLAVGTWSAAAADGPEGSARSEGLQDLWQERAAIMAYEGHLPRTVADG